MNARRLLLLLGCLVAPGCGADAAPAEPGEAAAGARQREAVAELLAARRAQEVTRGFAFAVVDQHGKPVAGIPIYVQAYRTRAAPTADGGLADLDARTILTGADGVAKVPPLSLEWMSADVQLSQLPMPYDLSDRASDIRDEHFVFGSQAPAGYRPPPDRVTASIDYIFHVWRYAGPRPLVTWAAKYQPLPEDATAVAWNATAAGMRMPYDGKPMPQAVPQPDFRLRFWVDPQQELLAAGGQAGAKRPNPDLRWWAEVECVRGGLAMPSLDGSGMMEAPEAGYADRISWGSVPGPGGSLTSRPWDGTWPAVWCYWRLPGSPARHGLARFTATVVPGHGDRPRMARMDAVFWFNPAKGDRLLERPMRRSPPDRGGWISGLGDAESTLWGASDPGLAPGEPIARIPARELP